jgi:hypothetical protein
VEGEGHTVSDDRHEICDGDQIFFLCRDSDNLISKRDEIVSDESR